MGEGDFIKPLAWLACIRVLHLLLLIHRREWLLAALIAGSAPVLGYTAFSLGYVGYVTTLFKLSTIMTVLWGFLFLKERNLAQRLPGALMMTAGTILIL